MKILFLKTFSKEFAKGTLWGLAFIGLIEIIFKLL